MTLTMFDIWYKCSISLVDDIMLYLLLYKLFETCCKQTDRQTDQQTHRPTDIVRYRAAIAAQRNMKYTVAPKNQRNYGGYVYKEK